MAYILWTEVYRGLGIRGGIYLELKFIAEILNTIDVFLVFFIGIESFLRRDFKQILRSRSVIGQMTF